MSWKMCSSDVSRSSLIFLTKAILSLKSLKGIGNPIASISYTLWNVKVTGKCAMMVDMATQYDELPSANSNFAQMRDSLYILSVVNQCKFSL